jgi:hypothetical protein
MLSNLFITFWAFMLMGIPVLAVICGVWGLSKVCDGTKNVNQSYKLAN